MRERIVVCNCGIEHTKFCVDCNTDIIKKAKLEEQRDCFEALESFLKILKKIRSVLNENHSDIPMVEVGRQNVLNDIDNEIKLDESIEGFEEELQELEVELSRGAR